MPVGEDGGADVRRRVPHRQLGAARHDERPRVERVRRDERDRHRVEPAHQDRATVREVVGGRARRRRADHPVARHDAEILARDRPAELDHPPERRARGDDVVDGDERIAVELRLERRLLDRPVLAREDAREVVLEALRRDRGEEADAPEIDPDHRYAGAEQPRQRAEDRPVAADGDRELRALRLVHELDAGTLGDRPHTLHGLTHVDTAVRDDRRRLNRRVLAGSARRGHREASAVRSA